MLKARKNISEHDIQCALVKYINIVYPNMLYCASIAGSTKMNVRQWRRANAAGYSKGFPDIFVYEARGGFSGLAVELKTEKGRATAEQETWKKRLNARGYSAHIAHGFDAAKKIIENYMKGERNA